jgi:hypothetical protein
MSFYLYILTLMIYFIYLDIMCYLHLETQIVDSGPLFSDPEDSQWWLELTLYEILYIVNIFLPPLIYLVYV